MHPPFRAGFHTNPPVEAFKHFEGAHNTKVTGGIGVACMHDPQSGQEGHIDANGVIKRGPSNTGRRAIWAGGNCDVVADKQLCLLPVTVAVVQQSVGEVGSCSLDVRVRCCRMQGRRRWRRVRLKVGRDRRKASQDDL